MQPSLLFDQGGGAIPYTETLAPGQDVRITSVNAEWDGAGASGTFLACLSLYSQSGVLLSRSFPSQQFAAGDSGVVTYAPPLGHEAAAAGATSLPSARAYGTTQNVSNGGSLSIPFYSFAWNDAAVFGYSTVRTGTPGPVATKNADYITINKEGWWLGRFEVNWSSDFTAGDVPYIEPQCLVAGSAGPIVNSTDIAWDDTLNPVYGSQYTADNVAHHQLVSFLMFNYDAAVWGANPVGIGVKIRSSLARTKVWGGSVAVTWLGDLLAEQTLV